MFTALIVLFFSTVAFAKPNVVDTFHDEYGWKLKVDGRDFYVKGVVWGYTPRGENYKYNFWNQPRDFIKKVIDHDFQLMEQAGVNAIRAFSNMPPEWITYVYEKYGIMTAVNPLMGRYGATVGAVFRERTDYSDELTRRTLKAEVLEIVRKYKDVPGVLMFALGNESNYGLSWSSFEIEDLPEGEQDVERAKYLYSLFAETIEAGKEIDPNHPFTIVNGDIQYLELINRYGADWDLLGVNVYRGISFTDLWERVHEGLGLPVLFFEFGSDAFNARDFAEDQAAQANYLRGQWQEMYRNSYGHGHGNSIGGFVFQWRDEWWKTRQDENLDVHDRNASWENGGYKFDHVDGLDNMNEEWFGITRLGDLNREGFFPAEPRMAYDVLTEVWKVDPYESTKTEISRTVNAVDMERLALKNEVRALKGYKGEAEKVRLKGGRIVVDMLLKGLDSDMDQDGQDGLQFEDGQMAFFDIGFQPTQRLSGDITLNVIANASDSDFEFKYGDRINPSDPLDPTDEPEGENVEIYDFEANYRSESFDLLGFYHVPRFHWGYKGDFYGLLRETTDMEGQDIWNAKAPSGVEFVGKQEWDGLNIVVGPEVYWGANPKAIVKYQFGKGKQYTFMHAEDFTRRDDSSSETEATDRRVRQTTLQAKFDFGPSVALEVGGIIAGTERIDDEYDRVDGNAIEVDEIDFEDTLGAKAKLSFDVGDNARAYAGFNYAGLVADGGAPLRELGTELPYSQYGNKMVVEAGVLAKFGSFWVFP
ncbi:MAG TPA: glycoside hydrolase family 2 TIM barrel-domain containing protein, partial [Oceanipulchritudo sp.]|nr:glycoside hydrolase family 2 TIM barrel-domain containing protein [Oceanipulchritudo sp.]